MLPAKKKKLFPGLQIFYCFSYANSYRVRRSGWCRHMWWCQVDIGYIRTYMGWTNTRISRLFLIKWLLFSRLINKVCKLLQLVITHHMSTLCLHDFVAHGNILFLHICILVVIKFWRRYVKSKPHDTDLKSEACCLQPCSLGLHCWLVQSTRPVYHSVQGLQCHSVLMCRKDHLFQTQFQTLLWKHCLVYKEKMLICVPEYTHCSHPLSRWWHHSCPQ